MREKIFYQISWILKIEINTIQTWDEERTIKRKLHSCLDLCLALYFSIAVSIIFHLL